MLGFNPAPNHLAFNWVVWTWNWSLTYGMQNTMTFLYSVFTEAASTSLMHCPAVGKLSLSGSNSDAEFRAVYLELRSPTFHTIWSPNMPCVHSVKPFSTCGCMPGCFSLALASLAGRLVPRVLVLRQWSSSSFLISTRYCGALLFLLCRGGITSLLLSAHRACSSPLRTWHSY